jgi:retron-type reverse transcriptase
LKIIQCFNRESSTIIENKSKEEEIEKQKSEINEKPETSSVTFQDQVLSGSLEKSKSDSKLNQVSTLVIYCLVLHAI